MDEHDIVIRQAMVDDLPALLPLLSQLDRGGESPLLRDEALELWRRIERVPRYTVHIAELFGAAVGTFSIMIMPSLSHGGVPGAIVESVVVDKNCRRRGVGKAMMERAIRIAEDEGCYKIALSSGASRGEAHEFYESLGFRRHGISFFVPMEACDA